jgi:shikimate dehydrogenase
MIENHEPMRLGLVGWPLGHSISPKIHKLFLTSLRLSGDYRLFPINPENSADLNDLCHRVRTGELDGLNVTIPYKSKVIQYLDQITPAAASAGAVNTIYSSAGKLIGDNTDGKGFILDLIDGFGKGFLQTQGTVLIIGAGGSARSVASVLLERGWRVVVAARNQLQAQALAKFFNKDDRQVKPIHLHERTLLQEEPKLIINATPVGMWPDVDCSPWPNPIVFPSSKVLYDLIYNPPVTMLMRQAQQAGLIVRNGIGMLVAQAAISFELWSKIKPPKGVMTAALNFGLKEIGGR